MGGGVVAGVSVSAGRVCAAAPPLARRWAMTSCSRSRTTSTSGLINRRLTRPRSPRSATAAGQSWTVWSIARTSGWATSRCAANGTPPELLPCVGGRSFSRPERLGSFVICVRSWSCLGSATTQRWTFRRSSCSLRTCRRDSASQARSTRRPVPRGGRVGFRRSRAPCSQLT